MLTGTFILEIDLFEAEILRVTTLLGNASVLEQSGLEHASPLASRGIFSHGGANVNRWPSPFQSEMPGLTQPSSVTSWLGSQGSSSGLIVKRTIRVDIPVDQYPNVLAFVFQVVLSLYNIAAFYYNFVGRLLGPRGNSLKRVEATTDCRVLIRGRGSIKDPAREEMMRGKPGYEHLNEPLHILVEAELPVEIIDARLMQAREILEDLLNPMDESQDFYKQQQLRELAMLNGTLRDESSQMSGSVSPFHNSLGMKRAKTTRGSIAVPVEASICRVHQGTGTVECQFYLSLYDMKCALTSSKTLDQAFSSSASSSSSISSIPTHRVKAKRNSLKLTIPFLSQSISSAKAPKNKGFM
ncbi:hypothetical protein ACJIZ3_012961 [Penstemon smallii]|uniref:K Homology domain-containing protein n=1 Tax=Penstemon smallii TaxID=265156 RepID=A0ABD3UNI7_9LAMI